MEHGHLGWKLWGRRTSCSCRSSPPASSRLTCCSCSHTGMQNRNVSILLQNENGPCPLLAASNCLLLRGSVTLPAHARRNGVTSLEDITNMLANHAIQLQTTTNTSTTSEADEPSLVVSDAQSQFFLNELMHYIPKFQYGMVGWSV